MKPKISFLFICLSFLTSISFAQETGYLKLVSKADSLYNKKDFKQSALTYSAAFKANGSLIRLTDRYNAACSWSLANMPDSAFINLQNVAYRGYSNYDQFIKDTDFASLHNDNRWPSLIATIKQNKEKLDVYKPIARALDTIFNADQSKRLKIDSVGKKFSKDSKEMSNLWVAIHKSDSLNLLKVMSVLDKYGWLGSDLVGGKGNLALFLVIQHSDLKVQQKYLPMMRDAVKNKKADASALALLEDRVALGEGKKQIYGSQIGSDAKTGKAVISPIADEINVNKRRAQVGLPPLEDYAKQWGINYQLPKQ